MTYALDHVLIAVRDLEASARELEAAHGLRSVAGGRHPGWGTANRIVPLGDTYLELVAVVDPVEASESDFGSWVAAATATALRPFAWAVRTDDLDAVASRLDLDAVPGSRVHPDGTVVRWRIAGVERAAAEPSLPFFIEWEMRATHPGTASTSAPTTIEGVELAGDAERLGRWLGFDGLPYEIEPGRPSVTTVRLRTAAGELVSIG